MKEMTTDQFHDLVATYISQLIKQVDFSDPETTIFTEEFDALLRYLQSRPNAKLKTVYVRESAEVKMLYRQLDSLLNKKGKVRIS